MKKILLLTIFILSLSLEYSIIGYSKVSFSIPPKKNVLVVFNRKTHFNDLFFLKNKVLKENGIVINYQNLKFDNEGDLISIEIIVDCKDGFCGTARENHLTNSSQFGFKRIYSGHPNTPFEIGTLSSLW